jgi:hypothetical protein
MIQLVICGTRLVWHFFLSFSFQLKNEQMPFRHCRWFVVPPPRPSTTTFNCHWTEKTARAGLFFPYFFFLFLILTATLAPKTISMFCVCLCVCMFIYCNYLRVGRLYTSLPWISIARSYLKYVFVHISVINILCWGLGGRVNGLIARPLPT